MFGFGYQSTDGATASFLSSKMFSLIMCFQIKPLISWIIAIVFLTFVEFGIFSMDMISPKMFLTKIGFLRPFPSRFKNNKPSIIRAKILAHLSEPHQSLFNTISPCFWHLFKTQTPKVPLLSRHHTRYPQCPCLGWYYKLCGCVRGEMNYYTRSYENKNKQINSPKLVGNIFTN